MPPKLLSIEKIITYDGVTMVHKIFRKRCLENLKGKFTRRNQISKYETSNKIRIIIIFFTYSWMQIVYTKK